MSACRYDRDTDSYLSDGEPCKRDQYGDVTFHCTARRTCSQHVGKGELSCARCVGRTRADIRQIASLAALMLPMAITEGVNSEAAMLAGPACDPEAWTWRKISARQGRAWHVSLIEDDDEHHPYSVLTRWQMMLSEDYGHVLPEKLTTTDAGAYLERHLHRIAQDPEQDFPLLARELRKVRNHLESVLHNSHAPERGAPCPICTDQGGVDPTEVRLRRHYGHWCDPEKNPECDKIHYHDESGDTWHCPRDHEHWWEQAEYEDMQTHRAERKMGA